MTYVHCVCEVVGVVKMEFLTAGILSYQAPGCVYSLLVDSARPSPVPSPVPIMYIIGLTEGFTRVRRSIFNCYITFNCSGLDFPLIHLQ